MKITDIRLTGLSGGTVEGGWADELKPEDDINTVVEVLTDEGLTGVGSAYNSKALVEAGVRLLRPLLIGERADEPARVTERLRQSTFWQGRGGAGAPPLRGIGPSPLGPVGQGCHPPAGPPPRGHHRPRPQPPP